MDFLYKAADLVDGKETAYTNLAQEQMDYILGGNPQGQRWENIICDRIHSYNKTDLQSTPYWEIRFFITAL